MKMVIDIPEYLYDQLHDIVSGDYALNDYELAIFNGTPLPKGHGRLIDDDELLKRAFVRKDDEGDIFVSHYYCIEKCDFNNLQTIIEADKEGSDADRN